MTAYVLYRGKLNLRACIVERDSGQTPSVKVWGAIEYNMRSRLLRIQENLNSIRYIREVLEPEHSIRTYNRDSLGFSVVSILSAQVTR